MKLITWFLMIATLIAFGSCEESFLCQQVNKQLNQEDLQSLDIDEESLKVLDYFNSNLCPIQEQAPGSMIKIPKKRAAVPYQERSANATMTKFLTDFLRETNVDSVVIFVTASDMKSHWATFWLLHKSLRQRIQVVTLHSVNVFAAEKTAMNVLLSSDMMGSIVSLGN